MSAHEKFHFSYLHFKIYGDPKPNNKNIMNTALSKNGFQVYIDEQHLENHLDIQQSGGTFLFSKNDLCIKLTQWIAMMTLPPETPSSFPGDPAFCPAPYVVRCALQLDEIIGWDSLRHIRSLPDGCKVEWQIRRGYLTKIFPEISPKPCKTLVLMVGHFDLARLETKILAEVEMGKYSGVDSHPLAKFLKAPCEWILLTAYPGSIAPPQNDDAFWKNYGFAMGVVPDLSGENREG